MRLASDIIGASNEVVLLISSSPGALEGYGRYLSPVFFVFSKAAKWYHFGLKIEPDFTPDPNESPKILRAFKKGRRYNGVTKDLFFQKTRRSSRRLWS
jgi:hypothetical protein